MWVCLKYLEDACKIERVHEDSCEFGFRDNNYNTMLSLKIRGLSMLIVEPDQMK